METQKILLTVDYRDESGKYWHDSYIKNTPVTVENGDVHKAIAKAITEKDGLEMSYKGKPQGNVYRDINGQATPIGYLYRTKTEMWGRNANIRGTKAYFTAWATIDGALTDYPIEDID